RSCRRRTRRLPPEPCVPFAAWRTADCVLVVLQVDVVPRQRPEQAVVRARPNRGAACRRGVAARGTTRTAGADARWTRARTSHAARAGNEASVAGALAGVRRAPRNPSGERGHGRVR